MPEKRARVVRSASFGEIDPVNQMHQVESPALPWEKRTAPVSVPRLFQTPVKNSKTSVAKPEQSRRQILTLASPVRDTNNEMNIDERVGGFLETCYYCTNRLDPTENVFMYGYLRAFCSTECRDEQIAVDTEAENFSGELTESIATESRWINNMKDPSGAQTDKRAAA